MSKETLTGELKKSLAKLKIKPYHCYPDLRKNKTENLKDIRIDFIDLSNNTTTIFLES
jgi:hypothetical protein